MSIEIAPETHPVINRIAGGKRAVSITPRETFELNGAYWDGGSKTAYRAYDQAGNAVMLPRHGGAPQFGGVVGASVELAPIESCAGVAYLVVDNVYRGKRLAPSVYTHPSRFEAFERALPPAPELTDAQREVLRVTDGYKSSYRRGEFESWAMRNECAEDYEAVRTQLREMKLLRKNNAITPEGSNAIR